MLIVPHALQCVDNYIYINQVFGKLVNKKMNVGGWVCGQVVGWAGVNNFVSRV